VLSHPASVPPSLRAAVPARRGPERVGSVSGASRARDVSGSNHHPSGAIRYTGAMANTATTAGSLGAPATRLRSLVDQRVTVTTEHGEVTGVVLSCTRLSVWIVGADDVDVVVALDEITGLAHHAAAVAA